MDANNGVGRWAIDLFSLDVRSLALWRVAAALLLLADVASRSQDIYALLTEWGVWPTAHAAQWNAYIVSLHFASGTTAFQALMLAFSATCSLCLLVGYRTRLASFLSWLLLTSLHNRNQMTQNAGDEYFRLLLLCSVFLPLGACFSLDSALDLTSQSSRAEEHKESARSLTNLGQLAPSRHRFFSGWTFAFMFQILILYLCTAILKTGDVWWNGQAVYYALSLDMYVTRLGMFVRQFSGLTSLLTWGTIIFEWIGPLLLVFPVQTELVRLLAVLSFCMLHLGFGSCLDLGLFMWIPQAAVCALLPALFWDLAMLRIRTPARRGLHIYYADEALLLVRILSTFFLIPETKTASLDVDPALTAPWAGDGVAEGSDVEEPSARPSMGRGQWLVAVNHKGEVARGGAALLCILAHSPFLFFLPPVLRLLRRLPGCSATNHQRRGIVSEMALSLSALRAPWRKNNWRKAYSGWRQQGLAVLFVLFTLNWNAALTPGKAYFDAPLVQAVAAVFRLDQYWGMFAPSPLIEDGWWVFPGTLQDGTKVDIARYLFTGFRLRGDEEGDMVSLARPEMMSDFYPSQRWSKLFDNLRTGVAELLRLGFGRYFCREWNLYAGNPTEKRLMTFDMNFMAEVTLPDQRTAPVQQITLWRHVC